MVWIPLAKKLAYWVIPPGVQDILGSCLLRNCDDPKEQADPEKQAILNRNKKFLNKHRGQRCFVLATGPSIREQDLRPLQNEWCIAVSEFYKHEHYSFIKPAYYAFAPTNGLLTEEVVQKKLARLEDVKKVSQRETYFFGLNDRKWVGTSKLVNDWERVYYVDYHGELNSGPIDLTGHVPNPHGAAVMATWIAIYMGFSEIYLVGCDHDHVWKWDGVTPFTRENYYHHFYDGVPKTGYEPAMDVENQLKSTLMAIQYYRWSSRLASQQGTRILNANPRNYLDVFPRVSLATLF